jgi:hypothetical protein
MIAAAFMTLIAGLSDREWTRQFIAGINWKYFFFSFIATIALIGTGFFLFPSAINGLGSGVYEYFHSFAGTGGAPLKVMFIVGLSSELLLLPLAIWGFVVGLKKKDLLTEVLGYGFILLAVLILVNPSRQMADWIWAILPLMVLASKGAEAALARITRQEMEVTGIQAGLTIILVVFSYLNLLAMIVNPPADAVSKRNSLLEVTIPLAFLIVVTILLAWGWSKKATWQGLIIGIGLLFLFVTLGTSWKAAGLGPRPETELWKPDPLPVGADLMLKTTNQLSLLSNGQEDRIDIALLNINSPSIRWSLRDYEKVSEISILGETDAPSIILSSADSQIGSVEIYRGQELLWTSRPDCDNMSASNWLKWFALRQAPEKTDSLLLWARNDLFKGSN